MDESGRAGAIRSALPLPVSAPVSSKAPRRHRLVRRALRALLAMGLAGLGAWFVAPRFFALPPDLLAPAPASPVLLDRHGEPLHHLVLPDSTRSAPVALDRIPADFIACTLAAEDKRFHDHGGVDLLATARAALDAARLGRAVSGASTVTQQLVKLSSPPAPRNLRTKLREAMIARHIEMSWPKDRILAAYFDRLHYGNRRTSPAEAARFYFQKPLEDLSLAECALLAGLPQAPSRLDPLRHPERAIARRNRVLNRLATTGKYDESRISAALAEPLRLLPLPEKAIAPWLPGLAAREAPAGPLQTTLDAGLQRDVEAIVREELARLSGSNLRHAAVVVLHNPTGEILAWVSSGNWSDPRGGQINGALVPRSPGSALKPFTWLLAFEKGGLQPGSIVADIPTRFRTEQGLDAPENYDRGFRGPVSVRQALACSLNVPAMRELNNLGGPRPLLELLRALGLETIGADPAPYGLGLTLGNAPVRLYDLTNAYAALARGGLYRPATLVLSAEAGAGDDDQRPLFDPRCAYLIADILSDPVARAPSFGRGGPLELPFRCAAKTGTSSDFRDNWCLGFTGEFTVGVWAGNFDNSPMKGLSGVAGAGPIFHRTMLRLHQDHAARWPARPEGLIEVRIDALTGKALTGASPAGREVREEIVPADRPPLPATAADYDAQGRVLLDSSYSEWFASEANRRRTGFALATDRPAEEPLRILAPRDGARYVIDPELPNGGVLRLATNLPGSATWSCSTLALSPGGAEPSARLTPGTHVLVATDNRNGSCKRATITVEER